MAVATQASSGLSGATTIIYGLPGWILEHEPAPAPDGGIGEWQPRPSSADAPPARNTTLLANLLADRMVRNSLALLVSSGLQAALGFTFWIVVAHLFSAAQVGTASSLISATALIAYFSLLGVNSGLIRFLPAAKDAAALITAGFLLVACSSAVISFTYVLLTPAIAPRLSFIEHSPVEIAGFVVLTIAAAINLRTDSVFIAARKAGYCTLTDGAVGGISKIVAGALLAGTGAFGLFTASVGGFAAAAVCSIALMVSAFHWRPSLRAPLQILRPLLKFSGANYAASVFNLLPGVVVPLIVLDRLGPEDAAYYFVAFQIAALLYAAISAVEAAFFAEGSQAGADWRASRRRSRLLAVALFVPTGVVLTVTARWVLLAFGVKYSQNASACLELLAAAVIPLAICNWSWTVLKLSGRLVALVWSNALYSAGICGGAWFLAAHGLTAVAAAWFAGAALGAVVATVPATVAGKKSPARHRKVVQSAPGS